MKFSIQKITLLLAVFLLMTALSNDDTPVNSLNESEKTLLKSLEPKQILDLNQLFDQLRFYEEVEQVKERIQYFGGVFSEENLKNNDNLELLLTMVARLEELRNSNVDDVLDVLAKNGVRTLLTKEDQIEIEKIQTEIKETKERLEVASTTYQKVLILNKLLPFLGKLLKDNDPISKERLLDVYYHIEILELQVTLVEKTLKNMPRELLETVFSRKEITQISEEIVKYRAVVKFSTETYKMVDNKKFSQTDLEERLDAYSKLRREYFLNEFPDLDSEITLVIEKFRSFERKIVNQFGSLEKFVAQIAVDAVVKVEEVIKLSTSTDYIDVIPKGKSLENSSYWIRIQLPSGSIDLLRKGHTLDDMAGSLSLVYMPDFKNETGKLEGNTFLPSVKFTEAQKETLHSSLKKIVIDVPLGIQVSGLNLSNNADSSLPVTFIGNDGSVETLNDILVAMPKDSPWTNFKNDLELQYELFNNLQISKQLGLRIEKITVDPRDFNLKLKFRTEGGSIVRSLLSVKPHANTFEISLKDIKNTQDALTDNLRVVIGEQIANRLDTIIKDENNSNFLKNLLIAERIEEAEVVHREDQILGRIRFVPKGFGALGETFQIDSSAELLFKTEVKEGRASVQVSNPFLPFEAPVRRYVKSFLQTQKEMLQNSIEEILSDTELEAVLFNLSEEVQFSKFQLDIDKRTVHTVMTIPNLSSNDMDVIIANNQINIDGLEETLQKIVKTHLKKLIQSQFTEPLEKNCEDLLQNKKISLYTFDFEITDVNCDLSQSDLTVKAVYADAQDNYATLILNADGQYSIESFKAPIIKEKVLDKIVLELKEYSDFKYLKVQDPRFENGILIIDAYIKIEVLNIFEKVGAFEISPNTKNILEASFSGVDIQTAFESKINKYAKDSLKRLIKEDLLKLEFSEEGNGLYITNIEKVEFFQSPREMVFWADAKLKGIIVPKFKITINLSANDILKAVKVELPADSIINSLLENSAKMTSLGGEIVPGLSVKVIELYPQKGPIRLEGVIEVKLNNLTFPPMKFTVTEKEIRFYPSLSFPLPGEYAISISPPLTIFGSSVSLDLDEKQIVLGTNITVGAPGVADANSKLINLQGSLSAYYSEGQFGSLDLEANLYLITVLQVMEGKGQIDTAKGCFSMSSRTTGPLRKILKYDNGVAINCNDELFRSETKMDVLGVSLETMVTAIKNGDVIGLNGEGRFNFIDIGKMKLKLGTTLEIGDINSVMRNAFVNLDGSIEVGKFDIARATVNADYYSALLSFKVLGVGIAMDAPSINEFSEDMILDEILQLLEFDPEVILEILKDPTKISFKMAPMGAGKSDGDNPKEGEKGDNPSGGNPPAGSGAENGEIVDTDNARNSSVSVSDGKVKTNTQGIFNKGHAVKILNRKDVKSHSYVLKYANDVWPNNVQKGIVLESGDGLQFDARYLNDNISKHFNSSFNFWKTDGNWVKYKKSEDGKNYYLIDKELFPANYGSLNWRVALAPDGKGYLYLEHNGFNLYQSSSEDFKTLDKTWLRNGWNTLKLSLKKYSIYKLSGRKFNPRRFNPLGNISNSGEIHYEPYIQSKDIYLREGNRFINLAGDGFKDIEAVGNRFFVRLNKNGVEIENIEAIAFYGSHAFVIEKGSLLNVKAFKRRLSTEIRTELERFSMAVGRIYVELPKAELDAIFNDEPWYNLGNNLKDNVRRLVNNHQGDMGSRAYKKFLILVEGLIEDQSQRPAMSTFSHAGREFLVSQTQEGTQKTFMDLSPDSNSWIYVNQQDIFIDLEVSTLNHNLLTDRFRSTPLVSNTFINIIDGKIPYSTVYMGMDKDTNRLFFYDYRSNLLSVQSNGKVLETKTKIYFNLKNSSFIVSEGDFYSKPPYISENASFFNELFKNLDAEKEGEIIIEDTEGYPIAYMLNDDQFMALWRNKKGGDIIPIKFDRDNIDIMLQKSKIPNANLDLIASIDTSELSYDIEELVQFLKLGYLRTAKWFQPDENQVHPLSILK